MLQNEVGEKRRIHCAAVSPTIMTRRRMSKLTLGDDYFSHFLRMRCLLGFAWGVHVLVQGYRGTIYKTSWTPMRMGTREMRS